MSINESTVYYSEDFRFEYYHSTGSRVVAVGILAALSVCGLLSFLAAIDVRQSPNDKLITLLIAGGGVLLFLLMLFSQMKSNF